MLFNIPILLIVFNRPTETEGIFNILRKLKPKTLYISADGPREGRKKDLELCEKVKSIITKIDWNCDYYYNINQTNKGCKNNVVDSINWFFLKNNMGIILEDDCKPNLSFFNFCKDLLIKFKDTEKIMQINGFNTGIDFNEHVKETYFFSKLNHTWGWATWKRAWEKFDFQFKDYIKLKNQNKISKYFKDKALISWIEKYLDKTYFNKDSIWSSYWTLSIIKANGLCITPSINLVKNIGFNSQSTSGKTENFKKFSEANTYEINKIIHPKKIYYDLKLDQIAFKKIAQIDPRASNFTRLKYYLRKYLIL